MKKNSFKKILVVFNKIKIEHLMLIFLFSWFVFSIKPFPFVQISDGCFVWVPRLFHAVSEIGKGQIPLWNEFQFCGTSFLADGNTNIFNFSVIFYFFMDPRWAYTTGVIIIFFILIAGTWCYFRERGFSGTASMIGTIGYVFGGQIIFWSLYHGMNLSLALFPAILVAFRRMENANINGQNSLTLYFFRVRWKILAFILIAISALGGFVQFVFIAMLAILIEGIEKFSFESIKKVIRNRFFTVLLALLSASAIILPTIESAVFSHRKLIPYFEGLLPRKFPLLLMFFLGDSRGGHHYPNYFYYIGAILLALAIFGLRKNFKKTICCPYFIYSLFPLAILSTIYWKILPTNFQFGIQSDPFRSMFVFIFALSLLAAAGSEKYLNSLRKENGAVLPPFELLILAPILFFIGLYGNKNYDYRCIANVLSVLIILGFIVSILFNKGFLKCRLNLKITILSCWLIVLMAVNCFPAAKSYLKSNVQHERMSTLNRWEKEKLPVQLFSGEGRFVDIRQPAGYLEDWGIYNRIRALGGYGSFFPRSIFCRMKKDKILPYNRHAATHFKNNNVLNADILAKYGVLYLVGNSSFNLLEKGWEPFKMYGSVMIYKNLKYIGRAYIADREGAILKGADILKNTNSHVEISVNADAGDTLILADSWFPGWRCFDNGKEVKGFDANGFRGYRVETSGQHKVDWIYKPRSFLIGTAISIFSFILFLLMLFNDFVGVKRKATTF
ncbi:MAG: hypothetical protein ABH869_03045 [Candidatus Omnitrophota bacterium]